MKKVNVVKKNDDFAKAIKKGRYYKHPYFVIYIYKNNFDKYRFGISVSKKLGNAVCRNKIKRQMRNIIDKYKNYYSNGLDYIIIIKDGYKKASFEQVENNYKLLIDKINSINIKKEQI